MSSHREAPAISKDPAADNTDVYAWVDPENLVKSGAQQGQGTMVNIIANFMPFELPYGGPNFNEFDDAVVYAINISNRSKAGYRDITYNFEFTTKEGNKSFLYNNGPIGKAPGYANWLRPQTYKVTKIVRNANGKVVSDTVIATGLKVPPCNVGERSTPNYDTNYTADAVHTVGNRKIFAGQRADGFYVDLGSVFDLGGLRPLNQAHEIPLAKHDGLNGLQGLNVHTIAMQLPIEEVQRYGNIPIDQQSSNSVIGVWASTHRMQNRRFNPDTANFEYFGTYAQMSRLANPLFNEVINPMGVKDKWNADQPYEDKNFASYVATPELGALLPALYPGAFPRLADFNSNGAKRADGSTGKTRDDLTAILLTGIPASVLKGAYGDNTFTTYTGTTLADMLRLNLAVKPTQPSDMKSGGVLAGDPAGFPNGRRPIDDVTTIELQAIAGLTIPLVYPDYKPDDVVPNVMDGSYTADNVNIPSIDTFPYLGTPASGYYTTTPTAGLDDYGDQGSSENGATGLGSDNN